jgi:hypothetical protein
MVMGAISQAPGGLSYLNNGTIYSTTESMTSIIGNSAICTGEVSDY